MPTYDPIATTTLGSATSSISFSGIPATYTDLRVVIKSADSTTTGNNNILLRFNSDTGTNYHTVSLYAQGTSPGAFRQLSVTNIILYSVTGSSSSIYGITEVDIFDYKETNKFKSILSKGGWASAGGSSILRGAGMWNSTSAITSLSLTMNTGNFLAGTQATIFGILAA